MRLGDRTIQARSRVDASVGVALATEEAVGRQLWSLQDDKHRGGMENGIGGFRRFQTYNYCYPRMLGN